MTYMVSELIQSTHREPLSLALILDGGLNQDCKRHYYQITRGLEVGLNQDYKKVLLLGYAWLRSWTTKKDCNKDIITKLYVAYK
jgi:hypothetical protein